MLYLRKGDGVVTSAGLFPHKTSYQSESNLRPHPFKMFVLNNEDYDVRLNNSFTDRRPFGVVVSPDTNVTTLYGRDVQTTSGGETTGGNIIEYEPENPKLKINTRGEQEFAPSFFKTGILEAFFEKNSALEWPKGYLDSLTPEQRYTPIRMLFNDVLGKPIVYID